KSPSLIPPFSLQYHVNDRPQIVFSADYAIMAYKSKFEVNFRLTNSALTVPIFKGTTLRPGSTGIVQSFVVRAFHNSFIISQKTGFHIEVFTFSSNDGFWLDIPSSETFHQQSVTCYSETFYAVAEPIEKKLIIFGKEYGSRDWIRVVVNVPDNV